MNDDLKELFNRLYDRIWANGLDSSALAMLQEFKDELTRSEIQQKANAKKKSNKTLDLEE